MTSKARDQTAILPEENSNGLSEELFAFDSVIRVSSYTGVHVLLAFVNDSLHGYDTLLSSH